MSNPKTLHILGGGEWQTPTIRLAKSLGYRVLVTDIYTERPGYRFADEHEVIDITDREATLRAAERHRIEGIVCDTTDVGVPTMAWVAERLGLAGIGYETALNFTNKHRMRRVTSTAGVPTPRFAAARNLDEAWRALDDIGLPAVVKPVDNQSSRGVHIIRDRDALAAAFADAARNTRSGEVLVEAFLDGVEVTVESFCVNGEVFAVGISDKDHFPHRPEVANRLTYPAKFGPHVLERIRTVNAMVICALGLKTGIAHAEYMVVETEPYLVEIAARGAGSRVYSHIVPYLAGAPVPEAYLRFVMGAGMGIRPDSRPRAANLAFFSFPAGMVREIAGLEEARAIPGVEEILLEFGVGDCLQPPDDDRSRPGFTVVLGETRAGVLATTAQVMEMVRVRTE
jgi:carbamoyl-phosphate synthase large subunit